MRKRLGFFRLAVLRAACTALLWGAAGMLHAQLPQPLPVDTTFCIGRLDNGLYYYVKRNAFPRGRAVYALVRKPTAQPFFQTSPSPIDFPDPVQVGMGRLFNRLQSQSLLNPQQYRPHLQAVLVVGDVDTTQVLRRLRTDFASLPASSAMWTRVPLRSAPLLDEAEAGPPSLRPLSATPPPALASVTLSYPVPALPRAQRAHTGYLIHAYLSEVVQDMLDTRLRAAALAPDLPFSRPSVHLDTALTFTVYAPQERLSAAFLSLATLCRQLEKYGFTLQEYQNAKKAYFERLKAARDQRTHFTHTEHIDQAARHFVYGTPLAPVQDVWAFMNKVSEFLEPHLANQYLTALLVHEAPHIRLRPSQTAADRALGPPLRDRLRLAQAQVVRSLDSIIYRNAIEPPAQADPRVTARIRQIAEYRAQIEADSLLELRRRLPGSDSLRQLYALALDRTGPQAFVYPAAGPLMPKDPAPGSVVSETTDSRRGATLWKLSNGINLYLVQDSLSRGTVQLNVVRKRRAQDLDPAWATEREAAPAWENLLGCGPLTAAERVLRYPYIRTRWREEEDHYYGEAQAPVSQTKELLQTVHLLFTAPKPPQEALAAFQRDRTLEVQEKKGLTAYRLLHALEALRYAPLSGETKAEADPEAANLQLHRMSAYRNKRMESAQAFDFILVGKPDLKQLRPWVCAYLATLPAAAPAPSPAGGQQKWARGQRQSQMAFPNAAGEGKLALEFTGSCPYSMEQYLLMEVLKALLRNDLGPGVAVEGGLCYYPASSYRLYLGAAYPKEQEESLFRACRRAIDRLAQEGPNPYFFEQVKEALARAHEAEVLDATYLLRVQRGYSLTGQGFLNYYTHLLSTMQPASVKSFVQQILEQNNIVQVLLKAAQ